MAEELHIFNFPSSSVFIRGSLRLVSVVPNIALGASRGLRKASNTLETPRLAPRATSDLLRFLNY